MLGIWRNEKNLKGEVREGMQDGSCNLEINDLKRIIKAVLVECEENTGKASRERTLTEEKDIAEEIHESHLALSEILSTKGIAEEFATISRIAEYVITCIDQLDAISREKLALTTKKDFARLNSTPTLSQQTLAALLKSLESEDEIPPESSVA